jgi:hypothetical protein
MTRSRILTALFALFILAASVQPAAAHYDPKLGRWMERDPIRYGDGMNMYQYVASNPVRFVDPSGMKLVIERDSQRGSTLRCLKRFCKDLEIDRDGSVSIKGDKGDWKKLNEITPCSDDEFSCDSFPGCALLRFLIEDGYTHTIRAAKEYRPGEKEKEENRRRGWRHPWPPGANPLDYQDSNRSTDDGGTLTVWDNTSRRALTVSGKRLDIPGCEILWHELIHAKRRVDGTYLGDGSGWEEVRTIKLMNKLRTWYKKCEQSRPVRPEDLRDPFGHSRRPEGPEPPVGTPGPPRPIPESGDG